MLASVLFRWFKNYENYLVEKNCLLIRNPSLGNVYGKIKFVDNPLKANITPNTTVTTCDNFHGGMYGFSFISFGNLSTNVIPENVSVGKYQR